MSFWGLPEIISFDALECWSYPRRREHQYSFLDDEAIREAIESADPSVVDDRSSWMSGAESWSTLADNPIHLPQVAKLVMAISAGWKLDPVKIAAVGDSRVNSGYCVTDGHHRLRALQFLKRELFPAQLRGNDAALDELRQLVAESKGTIA